MPFGQLVIGPPGSGKTTYCNGVAQYLTALGRKVGEGGRLWGLQGQQLHICPSRLLFRAIRQLVNAILLPAQQAWGCESHGQFKHRALGCQVLCRAVPPTNIHWQYPHLLD
jgi:hypothetical protein